MSKQFWIFLLVGVAVVGGVLWMTMDSTRTNHLELIGSILKIRTVALKADATLVIADFRVNNPSDLTFVVKDAILQLDPATGGALDGLRISKTDVDNVFEYQKLAGPKFNDVLSIRDKILPHKIGDWMIAARFEAPESVVEGRKGIRLHLEELDGVTADLTEKGLAEKGPAEKTADRK